MRTPCSWISSFAMKNCGSTVKRFPFFSLTLCSSTQISFRFAIAFCDTTGFKRWKSRQVLDIYFTQLWDASLLWTYFFLFSLLFSLLPFVLYKYLKYYIFIQNNLFMSVKDRMRTILYSLDFPFPLLPFN